MSATSVLAKPESDYTFDYSEKTSSNTYYNTFTHKSSFIRNK